jgi:cell division protein FtsN
MVKDYAKNNISNTIPKNVKRRRMAIIFIAIALGGLLPMFFYYTKYHQAVPSGDKTAKQQIKLKSSARKIKTKNQQKSHQANHNTTQFDFYTLLPKMKVVIPSQNSTTNAMLPITTKPSTYILQIASLQNLSDAERFCEQLNNLGYRSYVQPYQNHHTTWYRVMVGPYLSINQAEADQRKLHQSDMDSLLLRMKAKS